MVAIGEAWLHLRTAVQADLVMQPIASANDLIGEVQRTDVVGIVSDFGVVPEQRSCVGDEISFTEPKSLARVRGGRRSVAVVFLYRGDWGELRQRLSPQRSGGHNILVIGDDTPAAMALRLLFQLRADIPFEFLNAFPDSLGTQSLLAIAGSMVSTWEARTPWHAAARWIDVDTGLEEDLRRTGISSDEVRDAARLWLSFCHAEMRREPLEVAAQAFGFDEYSFRFVCRRLTGADPEKLLARRVILRRLSERWRRHVSAPGRRREGDDHHAPYRQDGDTYNRFEELHSRMAPRVREGARVRGMTGEQVEDVLQEVFSDLWRRGSVVWSNPDLTAGYFHEAGWKRADRLMNQKHELHMSLSDPSRSDSVMDTASGTPQESSLESVERAELRSLVRRQVQALPEPDRTVLILHKLGGLLQSEVAEVLGLTPSAVKLRVFRTMKRLREDLKDPRD